LPALISTAVNMNELSSLRSKWDRRATHHAAAQTAAETIAATATSWPASPGVSSEFATPSSTRKGENK